MIMQKYTEEEVEKMNLIPCEYEGSNNSWYIAKFLKRGRSKITVLCWMVAGYWIPVTFKYWQVRVGGVYLDYIEGRKLKDKTKPFE